MHISLSTGSLFTLPLKKVCELAAEAGFDGVELIINQDFQKINPSKLVASLQEITTIHSIHAPFMPLDGWGGPSDSLKRCVALAAECGHSGTQAQLLPSPVEPPDMGTDAGVSVRNYLP